MRKQKGISLMTGIFKGGRRPIDLLCGRAGSIFRSLSNLLSARPIPRAEERNIVEENHGGLNVGKGAGSGIVLEKAANLAGARSPQTNCPEKLIFRGGMGRAFSVLHAILLHPFVGLNDPAPHHP